MESAIGRVAPLEAVLFDIDGTMAISDPFHHRATSEMLIKVGYNGGVPITPEFGMTHMAGRSNEQIGRFLFPDWDQAKLDAFFAEKEMLFATYAREGLRVLREIAGLTELCRWASERAAVTNAPRANAELMISILGLSDFFNLIVTAEECERSKPFPDPYLKALHLLGASPEHTVVFEDSTTGVQASVAAGMPVIAIADESRVGKLVSVGASLVIRDYTDPKLWAELDRLSTTEPHQAAEAAEANGVMHSNS
ncbi:unnamed protein product [Urochloa humidicola]